MDINKRFQFWRVFWFVLGLYVFFALIGIIAASMSPAQDDSFNYKKLLTWRHLLSQVVGVTFSIFLYYYLLNCYYRLIATKKPTFEYVKYTVIAILVVAIYFFVSFLVFRNDDVYSKQFSIGLLLFSFSISTFFQIALALLISYLIYLRDEKKQRKVLEEQKMQLEVEKSQANFNFLKAQINPHFLHNTLNFLYAKSLPYSPELSEGILTLSDIMRYALSEGNAKDGKAPLKDEIEHVRNVIKINQLRFSNNLNVKFEVEGVVNSSTIIPFVLITLVENAFKHGDLKSNENPIIVKARIEKGTLHFYCRNKKKAGPKEFSTGIGLQNIKKRLDLAYGKDYSLNVKDEDDFYTTELIIRKL